MVSLKNLAVLAIAAATATAHSLDIRFRRFAPPGSDEDNHISKDTHLHDPHCKTFDHHEPAFYSFSVIPESNEDDIYMKDCYVTVFDREECQGNASNFTSMLTLLMP